VHNINYMRLRLHLDFVYNTSLNITFNLYIFLWIKIILKKSINKMIKQIFLLEGYLFSGIETILNSFLEAFKIWYI
jgi:hypothetical protein